MKKGRKITATFALVLFVAMFLAPFVPTVIATPMPEIDFFEPSSGFVGTEVMINGTIDTSNGTYEIRWDGNPIKTGKCEQGTNVVNDTFIVPESVWGPHNVTLYDVTSTETSPTVVFNVETAYYVFAEPVWVQEGKSTNITVGLYGGEANKDYAFTVNVTDPKEAFFNASISFKTDNNGSGNGTKSYLKDFGVANTDFVGTYNIDVNKTLAKGNFTVGLTDKQEYERTKIVHIRGSGYKDNENVTVNIEVGGASVTNYPKNITAGTDGVVEDSWEKIPADATLGTYTVTLTNATMGTLKEPADVQNFTVIGVTCQIQTLNLDGEPVAKVVVEAYNATNHFISSRPTNETGWTEFRKDFWEKPFEAGNYTFKAFWKGATVQVGSLSINVTRAAAPIKENITLSLARIRIAIKDESNDPLPFINVTLAYNYTTRDGTPSPPQAESFETETAGITIFNNTLTNISYTIEARRFDHLFNRTLIENLTASRWVNITCPTYTLFVHVLDANELPIHNAQVAVYEWSTWRPQGSKVTNESGSTDFFITFGRYKVSVSNYSTQLKRMVVINETVIDLVKENQWILVHCKLFNLGLSVKVVDHFGQPIPNALVKIKREGVKIEDDLLTKSNGIAFLNNTIGGEYQISVLIGGRPCGTETLYLDESKEIVFKIDGYVVIGGYPLETSQFITLIAMSLLVVLLGLALAYRKLPLIKGRKKPLEKVG